MRVMWALTLVLVVVSLCAPREARADPIVEARAHFQAGSTLYRQARYAEAIREFDAAYHLLEGQPARQRQILFNLAQAVRKSGDIPRAIKLYQQYVDESPAGDRYRQQVMDEIARLKKILAATPPPTAAPVTASSKTQPRVEPPKETAPTAVATALHPAAHTPLPALEIGAKTTRAEPSFLKRHWWILPVTALAVAGAAVGIYFAVNPVERSPDCGRATAGCLSFP